MSKFNKFLKNNYFNHGQMVVEKFNIVKEYWSENEFGFVVDEYGDVYAFGVNGCGQLGLGHNDDVTHEVKVEELSGKEINIKKIYEGNCCMFAQTVDGMIYSWGSNKWGQLGYGETDEQDKFYKPKKIEFKVNNDQVLIVDIKCGSLHNLALSHDGKVFGWGDNHARQITEDVNGKFPIIRQPVLMTSIDFTIKSIYCYDKTSFMITIHNEVYYYGRDIWGMRPNLVNDKDLENSDYIEPMKLDFSAEFIICNDEFIFYIMTNNYNKIELYKYKNHKSIFIADVEPSKKVKYDVKKQQSTSGLSVPSHHPKPDLLPSFSLSNLLDLSKLGGPSQQNIVIDYEPPTKLKYNSKKHQSSTEYNVVSSFITQHLGDFKSNIISLSNKFGLPAFATPSRTPISFHGPGVSMDQSETDSCPKEEITLSKVHHNKYTKLINILIQINNELEKVKNIKMSEIKLSDDKYAINLSPCTHLWDEAYEIIENDDYENSCYPVEEKVPKDILTNTSC